MAQKLRFVVLLMAAAALLGGCALLEAFLHTDPLPGQPGYDSWRDSPGSCQPGVTDVRR